MQRLALHLRFRLAAARRLLASAVSDRLDPMIPSSESPGPSRAVVPGAGLFLIDGFSHIAPRGVGCAGQLQLVTAIKAALKRCQPPPQEGTGSNRR